MGVKMRRTDVDWDAAHALQIQMEALGVYPVLSLTIDDVRYGTGRNVSDEDAEDVLCSIQKNAEFDWVTVVDVFAQDVPGEEWEDE